MKILSVCIAGGLVMSVAAGARAQIVLGSEGQFTARSGKLVYVPKACPKPAPLQSRGKRERAAYRTAADLYLRCVQQGAEWDRNYANARIGDAVQQERDAIARELERWAEPKD